MKTLYRSFAGGEITPELYGRLDLAKYQTGLAKCLNFTVLPHGPAARRPGFKFLGWSGRQFTSASDVCWLAPFQFNATSGCIVEFTQSQASSVAVRFWVNGQLELTSVAACTVAGSVLTSTLPHNVVSGWTTLFIQDRFMLGEYINSTQLQLWEMNSSDPVIATGVTTYRKVYELSVNLFGNLPRNLKFAQKANKLTLSTPDEANELVRLGLNNSTIGGIVWGLQQMAAPPTCTVLAAMPTPTNPTNASYAVTAVGFAVGYSELTESNLSPIGVASNNLTIAGNFNTISWTVPFSGTVSYYNVYKRRGGVWGIIGRTTSLSIIDDNILADTTRTPVVGSLTFNPSGAVAYYQQRRWFAGNNFLPGTIVASRSGTEYDYSGAVPTQDDDALQIDVSVGQQNTIRHLVPLADLLALTSGGELRIYSDNSDAITPTSIAIRPQGYLGSSDVSPVLTAGSCLYVQSNGSRIREIAYNWNSQAYTSVDLSVMAPHLFNRYTVVQLAFTRAPVPTLWVVRSDGVLLGLTYVPEQQVYAWHQHTTDGRFKSIASLAEGTEDVLYAAIERSSPGYGGFLPGLNYSIERMSTRLFSEQKYAFFVDSGLTYDGAPVTTVTGLQHLVGKTVSILADGAVHPKRLVAVGGTVTLDYPAGTVTVGIGYNSDFVTLPIAIEGAAASGQGFTKNVNKVAIRVTESSIIKAGPTFSKLREWPARDVSDPYDTPPALRTQEVRFAVDPSWNSDGQVCIRQDEPLPLTVMSMAVDFEAGG